LEALNFLVKPAATNPDPLSRIFSSFICWNYCGNIFMFFICWSPSLRVICHWTSFCRPKYFGLLLHYAPMAEVAQNSSQSEFMTDCLFIPLNNLSVEITVSFSLILHCFVMCQFLCCCCNVRECVLNRDKAIDLVSG
jgi:hypothetical protein